MDTLAEVEGMSEPRSDTGQYRGAIPRLEPKPAQIQLVDNAPSVESVLIDEYRVQRFLDLGYDSDELSPNVILSSAFADEKLEEWFLDREQEAALAIGADAIVPCDCPVYGDMPPSYRQESVRRYVHELSDGVPWFQEHDIEVLPLVKGESQYERGFCYDFFDDHDISRVAFYCVQYFTYGYRLNELLGRLQNIAVEYDPDEIMLIGLQSENLLPRVPPNVTAASGQRWLWMTEVGDISTDVAVQQYEQWAEKVQSALTGGQYSLGVFTDQRGWV